MHTIADDSCGNIQHKDPHDDNHVTIDVSHECDDDGSLNDMKAVKTFEKRPCSCLQEGTECKCGSTSKSRFSVRLEPWACYKTFLMSGVIILMVVWIVCYLTLMHKNIL